MIILSSIIVGFFSSLLSSVFGGGFGLLATPALFLIISSIYPNINDTMQIAITTGAVCAIPLGIVATLKQIKYKNIDLFLCKQVVLIMCIGSFVGVCTVSVLSSDTIKTIFSTVVLCTAVLLIIHNRKGNQGKKQTNYLILRIFSMPVAFISSLVGVSVFTVPFFVFNHIDIKKAIGSSTLIVLIYSVTSSITLIILGINNYGIGLIQFGYLNLPIFISAIIPCIIGGLVGAKLMNIFSRKILHNTFISLMITIAILMYI